ncbi:hypothetical protein [Streptomyces sp. NBC_01216]|uniref:hypothetical protein n=1 Tax=unclassified Streptomyces TaxID=2593676 RepID=UPI002E13B8CD|nr:hypothetical protein OG393_21855 [Streptomyces sp. NBC_01216]
MNHDTPTSPRSFPFPAVDARRVLCAAQLRALGMTGADIAAYGRPGGGWQQLLPGVFLLHPGHPTGEDRLEAALLYARHSGAVPAQGPDAVVTGQAALALHGFAHVPPPAGLERIEVLVPRTRRLRSAGWVRVVRSPEMPEATEIAGVPVAPVAWALADAVSGLSDAGTVRRLLIEAVRGGHCEPGPVVRELNRARLLTRPHVVEAVDALLAEGRAVAEDRLYAMVREHGLPDPVWNVDLRLPGGPHLGEVDAYWPDQAVAVELDTRARRQDDDALWSEHARKREQLERVGITVVHLTPRGLREAREQQATMVRTALMAAGDREPAAYVVVLPR